MALKPISSADLREVAPGIFYPEPAASGVLMADHAIIDFLKIEATRSPTRRARVCAHESPQANQHDMLIASCRETYVAPHRHLHRSESFMVIEGEADLLLFDENGAVTDIVAMGPAGSPKPFFYRMPVGRFHSLAIHSNVLIFLESTRGPFDPTQNENASWAPPPEREAEGRAFIAALLR